MSQLNKATFDAIVALLTPHLDDDSSRKAFVLTALFDSENLRMQIDYGGSARVFTTHLINKCHHFGSLGNGTSAVVALLDHLYSMVGTDKQSQINLLKGNLSLVYEEVAIEKSVDDTSKVVHQESVTSHVSSIELMPQPFAWIEIPDKGYSIAKYPITNAQFAKFIEADGYQRREWWTEDGWNARQEGWLNNDEWISSGKPWIEPRYWNSRMWNGVTQPVVGISWYEAIAFCLWLNDITGERILLPTENQWQYAAQGDDKRLYPWGNDWSCERCNNSVSPCKNMSTSSVLQYEGQDKGDSPFGVVDMVGNVGEWCLTDFDLKTNDYKQPANSRILRGGSWYTDNEAVLRCRNMGYFSPFGYFNNYGFRIVLNHD